MEKLTTKLAAAALGLLLTQFAAAGEVDVGDANSGSSISRVSEGWEVTPDPTPNDCSHVL